MFKLSMWWKDAITKLCLLYCVFQFFLQFYYVFFHFTQPRNPLIPESLAYFASFSSFLLIPFWAIGVFFYWKSLKNIPLLESRFWFIPMSLFGFLLGNTIILILAFQFNPFG